MSGITDNMEEGSPPNVKDHAGAVTPGQRVHLGTNLSFWPLLLEASTEVFDTTFFDTDTILIPCRYGYSIPIRYWYFSVIKFWFQYWYWYFSAIEFWYWYWYFHQMDWYPIWYQNLFEIAIFLTKNHWNQSFWKHFRDPEGITLALIRNLRLALEKGDTDTDIDTLLSEISIPILILFKLRISILIRYR